MGLAPWGSANIETEGQDVMGELWPPGRTGVSMPVVGGMGVPSSVTSRRCRGTSSSPSAAGYLRWIKSLDTFDGSDRHRQREHLGDYDNTRGSAVQISSSTPTGPPTGSIRKEAVWGGRVEKRQFWWDIRIVKSGSR